MNQFTLKLNLLQHCAAMLLLAAMLFQLGACPCGCLEHNAWLQLLGFEHDHSANAGFASYENGIAALPDSSSHHDCTGERAEDFVDNARLACFDSHETHLALLAVKGPLAQCNYTDQQLRLNRDRAAPPDPPSRPALQKFRL